MFHFSKYSGCGNTFVIFDNRALNFPTPCVSKICNQEIVDGLILLEPSKVADHKFQIYNRDGSLAEMCGNGLRCFIKYLEEKNLKKEILAIETLDGIKQCQMVDQNVCILMGDFKNEVDLGDLSFINTGVPHAVIFVDDIDNADVFHEGRKIRGDQRFHPAGTNVNFVELKQNTIKIRTYERGVENETLACGTGATASALVTAKKFKLPSPIEVSLLSKEKLTISFQTTSAGFHGVTMTGSAKKLSQGIVVL